MLRVYDSTTGYSHADRDSFASNATTSSSGYTYDRDDTVPVLAFATGDSVNAMYIDGVWYTGTILGMQAATAAFPEGTYSIRWYDGSQSEGVPPQQIQQVSEQSPRRKR